MIWNKIITIIIKEDTHTHNGKHGLKFQVSSVCVCVCVDGMIWKLAVLVISF